jgi:ABC-2 type transport system ATP-binding protein
MGAVIETSGLTRRYRRKWALHDCTLAIPEGHVVGLVGPNGAGKTTLLRLAAEMPDQPRHPRRRHLPARQPLLALQAAETGIYLILSLALIGYFFLRIGRLP